MSPSTAVQTEDTAIEANDPTGTIVTIDVPYAFEADLPAEPVAQPA